MSQNQKGIDIVSHDEHAEIDNFDENTSGQSRIATGESKSGKEEANVVRGYKATLSNPRVGEEAKERAQEYLEQHGAA
ncbi:Conidiation protein 6-domain-containing protein [Schizophyllum amplum]|uniref:Conidiation protein 6-domain-containing protein n=1 Tax=Schizophyllum amplum TaxID=97359 RepID=A0A550CZV9_9AGAR|nr:Conidiation protein 6-domain-containing protein [Auriculariopsis ampla]